MRNVFTIAGREVRSYFSSPVAYVLLAAFLALAGYFFFALLSAFNPSLAIYSMMRNPEMLQRFNLNEDGDPAVLLTTCPCSSSSIPAITMRMFPRRRPRAHTSSSTSPVRVRRDRAREVPRRPDAAVIS
jgi:ABC-2 type transport system permease protein